MKRILLLGILTLGFSMSAMEPSRDFVVQPETMVISPHESIFSDQVIWTDVVSFEMNSEVFVLKNYTFVEPVIYTDFVAVKYDFNYQKHFESEMYKQRESLTNTVFINKSKVNKTDKLLLYHPVNYEREIDRQSLKELFKNPLCFHN